MDFQELYILLDSGLCFYSKTRRLNEESDLLGGFFTAIDSFAKVMGVDNISSFVMGHSLYSFSRVYNLLFVIRTSAGIKREHLKRLLERVQQIFFKHFPPEQFWEKPIITRVQNNSKGNNDMIGQIIVQPEKFQNLNTDFEVLFDDPLEKLKASLWS